MLADICIRYTAVDEPSSSALSVSQGLFSGECFRADDEQGGRGVKIASYNIKIVRINVGNKVGAKLRRFSIERSADHSGSEVRATNADVNDISEGLPRCARVRAAVNALNSRFHARKRFADLAVQVFTVSCGRAP